MNDGHGLRESFEGRNNEALRYERKEGGGRGLHSLLDEVLPKIVVRFTNIVAWINVLEGMQGVVLE